MRHIIGNSALVAVMLYFVYHFFLIARWGEFIVREPNRFILFGEILLTAGMGVLGLVNLFEVSRHFAMRRKWHGR